MPNIYDNPNEKREQQRENHKRPPMGNGPAGLSAQMDNRVNLALIVITLAIVLVMLLFKYARGEGLQGMVSQPETTYTAVGPGLGGIS